MLRNPFTGQTLERISEDGEVLVMETTYERGGAPAPPHLHPAQEEVFTVLSGSVRSAVEGEVRILREGDVLVIPAGTAHEFGGDPDGDGRVRWEVRPPLRTWEFLSGMFGSLQAFAEAEEAGEEPPAPFDFTAYDDVFRLP